MSLRNNKTEFEQKVIDKTYEFIKERMAGESSGHDFWHIYRVWKNAINIARYEEVDIFIVELGALLHDVADWKFNDGDEEAGARVTREWLSSLNVEEETIDKVCYIVKNVSFKGAKVEDKIETLEGKVVQDADRLDAIGAIGVARAFAYGGNKGREMYDPEDKPILHESFEHYKTNSGCTVNHFYEKLLLLKDRMHTETAKGLAEDRHKFMEEFLEQFFEEWEGRR